MSNFKVRATLVEKRGVQQITDNYAKRDFIAEIHDGKDGKYNQSPMFYVSNKNTGLIDNWQEGEEKVLHFGIRAKAWNDKVFNNLEVYKIEEII